MISYDRYTETNTVRSLAIYDWAANVNMIEIIGIFDNMAQLIGSAPDVATVVDEKAGKDYLFRNFVKRNIIRERVWLSVGYLWKRKPETLSDFRVSFHCSIEEFRAFAVHVDTSATENSDAVFETMINTIVEHLQPIYGIGYSMPYYWGPQAFAEGSSSSLYATADKVFYGPPEIVKEQSYAFRAEFLADNEKRRLDTAVRDVFEINFLSRGHLDREVEGKMLQDWILDTGHGALRQMSNVSWRWDVPQVKISAVRRALNEAGMTIVNV